MGPPTTPLSSSAAHSDNGGSALPCPAPSRKVSGRLCGSHLGSLSHDLVHHFLELDLTAYLCSIALHPGTWMAPNRCLGKPHHRHAVHGRYSLLVLGGTSWM